MRKFLFSVIALVTLNPVFAQWAGSTTTSNVTYRDGNVGIGPGLSNTNTWAPLTVNGQIYTSQGIISDVQQAGAASGWFRGAPNSNSNVIIQGAQGNYTAFWLTGTPQMLKIGGSGGTEPAMGALNITDDGNIGIGTLSPNSKLHLQWGVLGSNVGDRIKHMTLQNGCGTGGNWSIIDMYSYRNAPGDNWFTASSRIQQTIDATPMGFIEFNPSGLRNGLSLGTNNQAQLFINDAGQVGIGTSDTKGYRFAVNGSAIFESIKVKLNANWPDYVFHKKYSLLPLPEVEKFIQQNNHLPEVPSATAVAKNGLDLGDNQAILLKKIEELTLYVIEQDKQIKKLAEVNRELAELKKEVKALQAIILTK